jgi:hypothetical protein
MNGNHPREFKKRCQLIIGARDEPLSVVAVRVNNPDCLPLGIDRGDPALTPTGFADFVRNGLPVVFHSKASVGSTKKR